MDAEDITDIFDSSLTTIFDIPPIGFAPDHSTGLYVYNPSPLPSVDVYPSGSLESSASATTRAGHRRRPVELRLPQPPSNLYTTLQANLIWPSALYLADLLVYGQINVKEKKVAELGAGAGLPGIVALRDGGAEGVVSTDWGVKEVLSVLEDNFTRACRAEDGSAVDQVRKCGQERDTEDLLSPWKVVGHQWGTDPAPLLNALPSSNPTSHASSLLSELPHEPRTEPADTVATSSDQLGRHSDPDGKFDILLLADVLWTTSSHCVLLDSINNILRRPSPQYPGAYGEAHITAGLHTGRGPVKRFIASAEERGMKIHMVREVRLGRNGWEEYDESLAKPGEEERGVVVYFTLRL
ncbi:hypothetical protein I317_07160 [Kwoniella heveanensis CBS 569]|nr:hypothetical protein I317_07160 [Kwoniella heveanensis CBS 569]